MAEARNQLLPPLSYVFVINIHPGSYVILKSQTRILYAELSVGRHDTDWHYLCRLYRTHAGYYQCSH